MVCAIFKNNPNEEHLKFFAELKGFTSNEALEEIETLAKDIQLYEKIDNYAADLSGGMKRKLSLGIALCGGSTNLILDEPSSGVDVRARRELWSILEKYRKNKTMLLSTHYMDEAEELADRIIILSKGQLKCSGSKHFLKEKLGSGYHLTMSLADNANILDIENFIQSVTPSAKLDKFYGKEAQYVLPFEAAASFPELFRKIDEKKDEINVQNYGVSGRVSN
jgi:ATP-binding cassette subfamily A (ABC1) protein 3